MEHRILVVGAGSIGERHMCNLRSLGMTHLAMVDSNHERLTQVQYKLGVAPFSTIEQAFSSFKPEIIFVCTPPALHAVQALQAVQFGAHVFIEKPLAHSLDGVEELLAAAEKSGCIVQVGYNLRFEPGLCKIKELLSQGVVGRVLWVHAEVGQYLPDWRPWQDYRQSYTAREELGGGIILDASHELDYVLWFLGEPLEVMCMKNRVSDLEVNVEDCATILMRFPTRVQADVHVDFVQRVYSRSCKVVGEEGTILWRDGANEVQWYDAKRNGWETFSMPSNDTYLAEVQDFLRCVEERVSPRVGLKEGLLTLKIALTAKSKKLQESYVS